jgi:pimeloyl-ACP methyl ester carboxylesterase
MTYEAMVEDLKHLMTQQGIVDPVLIGHSMGGKVAMQFAQSYPEALYKLVVVDIAPRAYDMTKLSGILQRLRQIPLKGVRTREEVDKHLHHYIPENLMRWHCMKNLCRDERGELVWRSNIPILADSIPHLERAVAFQTPFYKPTLFVKADQSDYIQTQDLPLIKTMFPNYVLKHIEHAGHWVNHDQPKMLVEAAACFLRG